MDLGQRAIQRRLGDGEVARHLRNKLSKVGASAPVVAARLVVRSARLAGQVPFGNRELQAKIIRQT